MHNANASQYFDNLAATEQKEKPTDSSMNYYLEYWVGGKEPKIREQFSNSELLRGYKASVVLANALYGKQYFDTVNEFCKNVVSMYCKIKLGRGKETYEQFSKDGFGQMVLIIEKAIEENNVEGLNAIRGQLAGYLYIKRMQQQSHMPLDNAYRTLMIREKPKLTLKLRKKLMTKTGKKRWREHPFVQKNGYRTYEELMGILSHGIIEIHWAKTKPIRLDASI